MRRTSRRSVLVAALAAATLAAGGCGSNEGFLTEERLDRGLVIILPGIEGESELNRDIRRGLVAGGVFQALPIHRWGRPIPLVGPAINQVDFIGNRLSGIGVANLIRNYQDSHPGRPVHIVGHSGGGGVAVFAAEALPEDRKIEGLILLSASISSAYDLTKAAKRCRKGIVNFFNPKDAGLLGVGTIVMGTVDGTHGPSSGLIGFDRAGKKDHERVFDIRVHSDGSDPHAYTTHVGFVSLRVAPWIHADTWPAGAGIAAHGAPDRGAPPPATALRDRPPPQTAPASQPASRPAARPATQPTTQPTTQPATRPATRPATP